MKMVELLKDFPPHVAAYRAVRKVNKEEHEQVVMARVDEVAAKYGKINFIVLLETDMENYSLGALADYLKVSFEHFSKWNRMAIATDERWVGKACEILSKVVHGEIKAYGTKDFEEVRKWVSAPVEADA